MSSLDSAVTGDPLLPPIDYTARDFVSIREDLIGSISTRLPEWTSRSASDHGIVLIDLFARMGDVLSFYTDRVANEAFLQTAVQRQSVLNIAAMLDYSPRQGLAAEVIVTFTVASSAEAVTIPKGTKVGTRAVGGEDAIIFETDESLYIAGTAGGANVFTGAVSATEGETVENEQVGTSTGAIDQVFAVPQSPVIEGSLKVCVDEGFGATEWQHFSHLIDASGEQAGFSAYTDANGILRVVFGDNVNGRIPAPGATITVTYRVGGGSRGNIGPTTITEIVYLDPTVSGVLSVVNSQGAVGGADPESLDEIRLNAPRGLRTLDRAVSLDDYSDLVFRSDQIVGRAKARGDVSTSVEVFVVSPSGQVLTTEQKQRVHDYMATRKMIGTTILLQDPTFIPITIQADIHVSERQSRTQAQNAALARVKQMLSFEYVGFGTRVTLSSVYRALQSIPGVEYAIVTVLTRTDVTATTNINVASPGATIEGRTMVEGDVVRLTAQTNTDENGWWIWHDAVSAMTRRDTGDVVIADNEIPEEGTFTINALGGVG